MALQIATALLPLVALGLFLWIITGITDSLRKMLARRRMAKFLDLANSLYRTAKVADDLGVDSSAAIRAANSATLQAIREAKKAKLWINPVKPELKELPK